MESSTVLVYHHPVTSLWTTFCFNYVYCVPDYFMTRKKTYTAEVRYVNKHIRDMLTCFGFGKCEVKAVALPPLKEQPKANELDKMCIYIVVSV
jgi:hypothetical protein